MIPSYHRYTLHAACLFLGGTIAVAHAAPGVEPTDDNSCQALRAEMRKVDQAEAQFSAKRADGKPAGASQVVCLLPLLGYDKTKETDAASGWQGPTESDLSTTVCLAPALGYTYLDPAKAERAFGAWRQRLSLRQATLACPG